MQHLIIFFCNHWEYQGVTKGQLTEHTRNTVNESNTLEGNVTSRQLQRKICQHKRAVHEGVKNHCKKIEQEASSKEGLDQHRRVVHLVGSHIV